ncbi:hypothetical protein K2F40_10870 [Clostridium sp. CM028]|uniref:hypothetical protein n=1 Tax=unclassified Clostridium TaxID=2614128 RepID=UPI001C0DA922|nr:MULTISPECIES: hypothetical protein [unclassified Clostridium]MBU3092702.1 hypothetical protein [Clostridium sp. CF011]MBW9145612.1 hypothetical protein [Clostridium sp. CM027]MBW9149462.1 hypothetical protein [Clostridium sp. CM028]UVE41534.1 hypothetical protein KTC92_03285 [Clostridium sp. CM027]WAG70534.1 hypothetical protein LL036_03570 [Clostridium sp. CF011]
MAITREEFIARPGIINKQGHLPDPSELVCVEIPKVFDQCLIKRCLVYSCGQDTVDTDEELRSDSLCNPKIFTGCRDFQLKLISVEKIPLKKNPSYKKVLICFRISFYADYINCNGETKCEFFEINRTEVISKLYCPDSIAQISASFMPGKSEDLDSEIIKLELVAECLDGVFCKDDDCHSFLDITLGFHLIVKCELIVQLLIPAYGYCPVPCQCEEECEEDACEKFDRAPVPKFFPDQKLRPLFDDECEDDE